MSRCSAFLRTERELRTATPSHLSESKQNPRNILALATVESPRRPPPSTHPVPRARSMHKTPYSLALPPSAEFPTAATSPSHAIPAPTEHPLPVPALRAAQPCAACALDRTCTSPLTAYQKSRPLPPNQ